MRHDVYPLPYNSATPDNTEASNLHKPGDPRLKDFFSSLATKPDLFSDCNLRHRLLMVGPVQGEWNVLRTTDGERFVVLTKDNGFWGELLTARIKGLMRSAQFED
jgi:hypothetical protein